MVVLREYIVSLLGVLCNVRYPFKTHFVDVTTLWRKKNIIFLEFELPWKILSDEIWPTETGHLIYTKSSRNAITLIEVHFCN